MGRPGALINAAIAILVASLLLLSGPGASLTSPTGTAPLQPEEEQATKETPGAPLIDPRQTSRGPDERTPSLLRTDFASWNSWSLEVPVELLIHHARADAPTAGQRLIPAPDTLPGHAGSPEPVQRELWRSWWLATEIAALRSPSVPLDPMGGPLVHESYQDPQQSQGYDDHEAPPTEAESPVGEPRGLERLWRLQAHGPPRIVLTAGDGEQMYLVTDRGVLFIPEAGAQPDWMLNIEGIAGHAEVVERDGDGLNDLVIGVHTMHLDETSPSIWVIDGATQEVAFHGLRGDRALMHWTLTDVDGDGEKDILGIDRSNNITALGLDGEEIYRTPVPRPDLPEASMPAQNLPDPLPAIESFAVLALVRTGTELFGDATGDGTSDIFTTSFWGPFLFQSTAWLSLVDGTDGQAVWSRSLDAKPTATFRVTTPVATGDLNGDDAADVGVYDMSWDLTSAASIRNSYIDGANGVLLAQDPEFRLISFDENPFAGYVPVAFVDLDGDDVDEIVAVEGEMDEHWVWYRPFVHVRTLPQAPGAPTMLQERIALDVPWDYLPSDYLQIMQREVDDKDIVIFLSLQNPYYDDGEKDTLFLLDESGLTSTTSSQPIGHFDIHPKTGQAFAWTLKDDRFTPVDRQLSPMGNGTRLIMSPTPLLDHSGDGGVPDLLISRTMGYFWVSGRTGAILEAVERPLGTWPVHVVDAKDEAWILERTNAGYSLFDVAAETILWNATLNDLGDAGNVRSVADFTGDGGLEILFQNYGGYSLECDDTGQCRSYEENDRWSVYSPDQGRFVWEVEGNGYRVASGGEAGSARHRLLVVDEEGSRLELHDVDAEEPVWAHETGHQWIESFAMQSGYVAVWGYNEEHEHETQVYELKTGSLAFTATASDDEEPVWVRLVETDKGAPLMVQSFTLDHPQDGDKMRQLVRVSDLKKGEQSAQFDVTDALVITETYEFLGTRYTYSYYQYTWPGPVLGEWNDDGSPSMAFREDGWPTVRSLKNGDVLAVGPLKGTFNRAIDLNGDDRFEVGLGTWGSLRMYAYDPSGQAMEREDPLERVDAVDPDEGDGNSTKFFDGDDKKSPAPGLAVLLFVAAALALVRRRTRK